MSKNEKQKAHRMRLYFIPQRYSKGEKHWDNVDMRSVLDVKPNAC